MSMWFRQISAWTDRPYGTLRWILLLAALVGGPSIVTLAQDSRTGAGGGGAGGAFLTRAIEIDGEPVHLHRRVVRRSADQVVSDLSLSIQERVERVPAGWEQSWRFDAAAAGDLVVRVGIEGRFLGEDDAGITFGSGGSRIRYSHATLLDAAGRQFAVPSRWIGGAIELRVPADTLAGVRYPIVLDPTIGMAHPVAEPELLGGSVPAGLVRPVWNGTSFALFANHRIVFASADGTVMHPSQPIPGYSPCTGIVYFAHHGSDGYRYVCGGGGATRMVHFGDDLTLLSSADLGFSVANTVWIPGGSGRFLVVDSGRGPSLNARIVDASGTSSAPFVFATGPGTRFNANAIWTGATFFVVYEDDRFMDLATRDLRGTTIGLDGTVGSTDGIVIAGSPVLAEGGAKLAPAPGGALLSYSEQDSASACAIRTMLVDASGGTLPGVGSYVPVGWCSSAPNTGMFTGTGWLFHHGTQGFVRFDLGGTAGRYLDVPMGPRGVPERYAWAWGEATGLYTFIEPGSSAGAGPWLVALTDIDGGGTRVRPVVTAETLSAGHVAGSARAGVVASFAGGLRRLGPDGAPLGAATVLTGQTVPVAVGDGFHAFLFGSEMLTITSLDPDGTTSVSSVPWVFGSYGSAAAGADDQAAVVTAFGAGGVYGTRIAADGAPLDATRLRWSAAWAASPTIVSNGSGYLVLWESLVGTQSDVVGIRVGFDGLPIDRTPLVIANLPEDEDMVHAAALTEGWLVAWRRGTSVVHRLVHGDGSLGSTHERLLSRAPEGIDVEWGGTRAMLVYREDTFDQGIFGIEVAADGTPGPPFLIVETPQAFIDNYPFPTPALASLGADSFVLLYAAVEDWLGSTRLMTRMVTLDGAPPLGAACASGADCGALACVDGVCCNTTCGAGLPGDCEACSVAQGAPADGYCSVLAGVTCRAAAGACDVEETCQGRSRACAGDLVAPDGAACSDGDPCNGIEACAGGVCVAEAPIACDAGTMDAGHPDSGRSDAGGGDSGAIMLGDATIGSDVGQSTTPVDAGSALSAANCACRGGRRSPRSHPVSLALGAMLLVAIGRRSRRSGPVTGRIVKEGACRVHARGASRRGRP